MPPFRVRLPRNNLSGHSSDMRSILQTWNWRWRLNKDTNTLILDFKDVKFIEPWALTMFVAYGLYHKYENNLNVIFDTDPNNPSNTYIIDMGLKSVLEDKPATSNWDDSEENTGLHRIRTHQDVNTFTKSASRLGKGPSEETIDALKYTMSELGRNIVQHSASKGGGIAMAQYFPDANRIQIALADPGIGIRTALERSYPEIRSSLESLKLSVLPHVSGAFQQNTYSASDNAGLGLFFTKEICWRTNGRFWIASKDALMGIEKNDESCTDRIYKQINSWRGTLVAMDFPAQGVVDFSNLLQLCRELAAQARESRGRAGLDFIDGNIDIDDAKIINVHEFVEDVEIASKIRESTILPAIKSGETIILDFGKERFVTQSFVHALLKEAFNVEGSLTRISFINCTKSTEEAIRTVAAYSASYRMIIE